MVLQHLNDISLFFLQALSIQILSAAKAYERDPTDVPTMLQLASSARAVANAVCLRLFGQK